MSAIPSLIFCTILPYSVLSLSTPNLTRRWQPGVLRENVWTQGSWKGRLQEGQAVANRIQGGWTQTDRDEFPWFAFLSYTFPDFTWEIWDPVTKTTKYKEKKSPLYTCGGAWVTTHIVLTARHCVHLRKPPYHVLARSGEDPMTSYEEDLFYRNVITDSIRGSTENVAIRLYGLSHFNSYPYASNPDSDDPAGTIHPAWELIPKSRAFRVIKYRTLPTTDPPMDLAILEMNKLYIENHFRRNSIDLNEIFARLKWVDKYDEKLKVGENIIQLGSGEVSDIEPNDWQVLHRTLDYARVSDDICKEDPNYTPAWEMCLKSWGIGRTRVGDSGSPGFTLVSKNKKSTYRLHSLVSGGIPSDSAVDIHMYVGDLRKDILELT